jgi:hypothetical protein
VGGGSKGDQGLVAAPLRLLYGLRTSGQRCRDLAASMTWRVFKVLGGMSTKTHPDHVAEACCVWLL